MAIKQPLELTKDEQDIFTVRMHQVFSPDTPVTTKTLFAGRTEQIGKILKVVFHPGGRHVVVYGERGVGKTSLATVLPDFIGLVEKTVLAIRISCSVEDSFDSLWKKMFSQITVTTEEEDEKGEKIQKRISEMLGNKILNPHLVQQDIVSITDHAIVVLIFDEFDVVKDERTKRLFAELIKSMSDENVKATIVLIGVADSVDQLIGEHESIERNLSQVKMPRMNALECRQILDNGLEKVTMGIENSAVERIEKISQGLPTYIHSLGLHAGLAAVESLRRNVELSDVNRALEKAVDQAHQSIKSAYAKAVSSAKKNHFKEALLACALAKPDQFGYFSPGDVREPFRIVTKEPSYDIPNLLPNLSAFTQDKRGPALQRSGEPWGYKYRFRKALLQPFVIMLGLKDGLITQEQLDALISST